MGSVHAFKLPPGRLDVSVCVCAYRRAHLSETLRSVLAQTGLGERRVEIIVADDDPEGSAQPLVQEAARGAAFLVRYVFSGARNVAAARNACLDAAAGDWIAFIDDDETAEPDWLASALAAQAAFGADVVKGRVRGVYPEGSAPWVYAADPYSRDYGPTGAAPTRMGTGNILIRRALIETRRLRFDEAFGRTGGEDTDFIERLWTPGVVATASREAVVNEITPAHRLDFGYLSRRRRRMGQVDGLKSRRSGWLLAAGAAGRAAVFVAMLWVYPVFWLLFWRRNASLAFKIYAKFWYSVGILQGVVAGAQEEMTDVK
jgi:succinoglycan biosynthesis protein ExoM